MSFLSLRAFIALLAAALFLSAPAPLSAQRLMENLGRGVVAVRSSSTQVFLSWRLLGVEPGNLGFNVYRATGGGAAVKLNASPLVDGTHYTDTTANLTLANVYHVRPVVNGLELAASAAFTLPANAPVRQFLSLPLQATPVDTYVHLVWVGDLDGDGEFDYVVSRLPLVEGSPQFLDGYKSNGTFLWRVNFGPSSVDPDNIEPAAAAINAGHNDGVTVYDLDCDGRAEVIVKSANGVIFGNGATLVHGVANEQFISVLDGLTGAERARAPVPTDYLSDGPVAGHFGIAYLDGVKPSFVFKAKNRVGNGGFNLFVATWDFNGTALTQRWKWLRGNQDCPDNHQIRIVDVDRDGKDEICDGGYVLDDNGTLLYSLGPKGVVHGDRFHIGDLNPARPGLEGFGIQQNNGSGLLYFIYDAANGALLRTHFGGVEDTARGTAADIHAGHPGYEYWSFHGIHRIDTGDLISPDPLRPWPNFRIWWDGDVMSENMNRNIVEKWNPATGGTSRLLSAGNDGAVNSWRDAAQFYGDILGDWREEIVFEKSDHTALLIYTTTTPTTTRLYTLPHNPEYRACFTVKGYLQSNMIDYYLGEGMSAPPAPNIAVVNSAAATVPVIAGFSTDSGVSNIDHLTNDTTPSLGGTAPAGATVAIFRLGAGQDGAATADGAGNWTFNYSSAPLADGLHVFTARIDLGGGNFGPESAPFFIEIDTAPPAAPQIAGVTLDGSFIVVGTAAPGLPVGVTITGVGAIGSTVADAQGAWSVTYAGPVLPPASYTFVATTTDPAGNTADSAASVVDSTLVAPAILAVLSDTGVSPVDRVTSDPTISLQGTASPGSTVSLLRFGVGVVGAVVADGGGSWIFDYTATTLADGAHAFSAFAASGAGTSPGSPIFSVTVDGIAPAVVSVNRGNPVAASTSAAQVTFAVTFGEAVGGIDAGDFTAVFGGGLSGAIQSVSAAGGTTVEVVVGPLTGEGTVRLDVNAAGTGIADTAGNALAGGFAVGQTYTRLLEGSGVWLRNTSGGLWNDNPNWDGGIVANGSGALADFSALEIADTTTVQLDVPRTVGGLTFGDIDTTSPAGWIIGNNGNAANVLTFAGGSTVTVNALGTGAVARIAATLGGTAGLTKAGPGVLVLAGANTLTGTTNVNAGTLRIEAGNLSAGAIGIASGTQLAVNGGALTATGTTTVNAGGSSFVLNSGSAALNAVATNNNSGALVRINGGAFSANSVSFQRSTDGNLNYATGLVVTGGASTIGSITLGTANSNAMMSVEGGSLVTSGPLTLGNQSSSGRGGHLRVTGGTFTSTDAASGVIVTRRNNNTSTANFLGGVSTIEKATIGFDATVTSGAGTLNVNGGTLYIGAGGIVSNAGGGFAANVNLTAGVLGAKANWATTRAITLPTGGAIQIKAANALGVPFSIALNGAVSGAGGFTKTGDGTLTLGGANTFAGPATVSAGTLAVTGSITGPSGLVVSSGGTVAGSGAINRPVTLLAGSSVSPSGTLSGTSLTWDGGARARFDLGSDLLALSGALTKGTTGVHEFIFSAVTPPVAGTVCPLINYGSTTFTAADFVYSGLPDFKGVFQSGPGALAFLVTGSGASAEFTHWAYLAGLLPGQNGPADDPDGDGLSNLREFVHRLNPLATDSDGVVVIVVAVGGESYPALTFSRNRTLGGVALDVRASTSLDFTGNLGTVEVSVTPQANGTDAVVVRSLVPLSQESRQFLRLFASLPN